MPATVRQHAFSPKIADGFKDPTASTLWYSTGSDDEAEVIAAALAEIPETFYNLVLKNISYENRGGGFWDIEAHYEVPNYIDSGGGLGDEAEPNTPPAGLAAPIADDARLGPEFSADLSGGTAHITQSNETKTAKKAGDPDGGPFTANDYKQAIGVTKDGVAGCDRFSPKFEFSMTFKTPFLTWAYIDTIAELSKGCVNSQPFLIFDLGEVLYLGGTPHYQSGEGWTITHKFAVSKNETEVVISDTLTLKPEDRSDGDPTYAKYGWEYLWVEYNDVEVAGALLQRPVAAYIETIYDFGDFSRLGFGGPA